MALSGCMPVDGGIEYVFGANFHVRSGQAGTPAALIMVRPYDGADCTGNSLSATGTGNSVALGQWLLKSSSVVFPEEVVSAQLLINVFSFTEDELWVHVDSVFLFSSDIIFNNGFEG